MRCGQTAHAVDTCSVVCALQGSAGVGRGVWGWPDSPELVVFADLWHVVDRACHGPGLVMLGAGALADFYHDP